MQTTIGTGVLLASLSLAGAELNGQPLFGGNSLPIATKESESVPFSDDDGLWKLPISGKGVTRLIQVVGLGSEKNVTAGLVCSSGLFDVYNKRWIRAASDCVLEFKPDGLPPSEDIKLTVQASALESAKIVEPVTEDMKKRADQDPVKVTLILKTKSAKRGSGAAPRQTVTGDYTAILVFGIVLIVGLIGIVAYFRYGRRRDAESVASERIKTALTGEYAPARQPEKLGQREVGAASESNEEAFLRTQSLHARRFLEMESQIENLSVRVEQIAGNSVSLLTDSCNRIESTLSDLRNQTTLRVQDLEAQLIAVTGRLSTHLENQSSKLQDLLKDLPTVVELGPVARVINKSALVQLEEQLLSAATQNTLSTTHLESLRRDSSELFDAIHNFLPAAVGLNKDKALKRFSQTLETLTALHTEVAGLSKLAISKKHGFFVELSLLEKHPLADDLAAALKREVVKLSDPDAYYRKRLSALRAQACVAAIDLVDLDLDSERRNLAIQEALANLLKTLGIREIDPRQNDQLQTSEHQVLQFVSRSPGAVSGTIAHTMARGLWSGSEVLRKASVLLYD